MGILSEPGFTGFKDFQDLRESAVSCGLSEPGFTGFKDFQDMMEDESTPNARVASQ